MPQTVIYCGTTGVQDATMLIPPLISHIIDFHWLNPLRDSNALYMAIHKSIVDVWIDQFAPDVGDWKRDRDRRSLQCRPSGHEGVVIELIQRARTDECPGGFWILLTAPEGSEAADRITRSSLYEPLPMLTDFSSEVSSTTFTEEELVLLMCTLGQPQSPPQPSE